LKVTLQWQIIERNAEDSFTFSTCPF
jgi:hypothetical protein